MPRPKSDIPTDWELQLIQILWDAKSATVDDIREVLRAKGIKRSDSALRTILRAMLNKGLVIGEKRDRTTYYSVAYERPRLEKKFFSHLIQFLFKGSQEAFVLRVLDESKVTKEIADKMKEKMKVYKEK